MVVWHLKQIGKMKKLDKWVPHELTANQKNHHFEVLSSLSLHNNKKPFLDCDMWQKVDCVRQLGMTSSVVEPRSSKALPKTKLAPKKVMVTVWWSAVGLIHYSFLNPGETIAPENYAQQIDDVHRKLQCLHPALINRKGPVFLHDSAWPHGTQPTLQKLNELGYKVSPHLPRSPDLSPADYHFFKHLDNFLQGKCFHNQQDAENAFQEFAKSWSMDILCFRNKQTYFSLAKMCWL